MIKHHRSYYTMNRAKLSRARRLYCHLVTEVILKNPDCVHFFADKALKAGLYSSSIGHKDVVFYILRRIHRSKYGSDYNGFRWYKFYEYLESMGFDREPKKRNGKFLIRIKGASQNPLP